MTKQELETALALQVTVIEAKDNTLAELRAQVVAAHEVEEKLKATIKSEQSYTTTHREEAARLKKEIDEMHSCFDDIDGVMPREKEAAESWQSPIQISLPARFASYCRTLIK